MENRKPPEWLQELLDAQEAVNEKRRLEMNKVMADRALAAIKVLEEQADEATAVAEEEFSLIDQWRQSELMKIQKKISWLSWNLENFVKATSIKTLNLVHGTIKIRMGKNRIEVVDLEKFLPVGQRLGLVRRIEEHFEPDLVKIHEYVKTKAIPPGVLLTPAQSKFSYKTNRKGNSNDNGNEEREQTEAGSSAGHPPEAQVIEK